MTGARSTRTVSRPSYERFEPRNRAGWRRWLTRNYAAAPGVWLVYLKGAARQIKYDEAVEKALCFGWTDSTLNPIDAERYMQLFTPRKPRSGWSRINKVRVEDLLKRGLMTSAGLEKVDAARKDGAALDAIEALELPAELTKAFASNRKARENFAGFSPFSQNWCPSQTRDCTALQEDVDGYTRRPRGRVHREGRPVRQTNPLSHPRGRARRLPGRRGSHEMELPALHVQRHAVQHGVVQAAFGRITALADLPDDTRLLRLVKQAAALNDEGVKVARMPTGPRGKTKTPDYFIAAVHRNKKALATYEAFSPSHKREYVEWVTEAKAEATRKRPLETAVTWMAEGKGRHWKYMPQKATGRAARSARTTGSAR